MVKVRQTVVAAAAVIALMSMTPAMANGHGFRPVHGFGVGHGLLGAAVALATLPLVIASNVVAGISESVVPYPSPEYAAPGYARPSYGYAAPAYGYAPPVVYAAPRPFYAPYPGYYAPRVAYGPRAYYNARPGYYGRGYYRSGGNSYPHR
jgi:hypothetical protein